MGWTVEFDDEFSGWFESLDGGLQDELYAKLKLLAEFGPSLRRPNVGNIHGSRYQNLKELIVQYKGDPWRVLFAFDPRRTAVLLVGGNKRGDDRWYEKNIPIADSRYKSHLDAIMKESKK